MPKLPTFQTDEELITWFDTHDTAEYLDEMDPADGTFAVIRTEFSTRPLDVRVRSEFLSAIEALADRRGIPYQRLIQTWLLEKLTQEGSDLLPHH